MAGYNSVEKKAIEPVQEKLEIFTAKRFAGVPFKAQHECWLDSFMTFKGILIIIAKKLYVFVFFSTPVSLWISARHVRLKKRLSKSKLFMAFPG